MAIGEIIKLFYLLKFLEFIEDYYPNKLESYFKQDLFVYANVPYRIKRYQDILKDAKNTIDFDFEREKNIHFKREEIGVDGALLRDNTVFIYKVNLVEKILATVLAKNVKLYSRRWHLDEHPTSRME